MLKPRSLLFTLSVPTLAVLFAACGALAPETPLDTYTVSSGTITAKTRNNADGVSEDYLEGTGTILFSSILSGASDNHNFHLAFELEDGGSLVLVTHASSGLVDGFRLTFTRAGSSITALASGPGGNTFSSFPSRMSSLFKASSSTEFYLDVHGAEHPLHLLVFEAGETSFTETVSLFNSADPSSGWPTSPATGFNGTGSYWGLDFTNALVTRAHASSAKLVD